MISVTIKHVAKAQMMQAQRNFSSRMRFKPWVRCDAFRFGENEIRTKTLEVKNEEMGRKKLHEAVRMEEVVSLWPRGVCLNEKKRVEIVAWFWRRAVRRENFSDG